MKKICAIGVVFILCASCFAQIKADELSVGVKLGTPYMMHHQNVAPSDFTEISFGSEFLLPHTNLSLSPILSVDRYVYSSEKHFTKTAKGYEFTDVPPNYATNRLQMFTANIGVAVKSYKKLSRRVLLDVCVKPQIGFNVADRSYYFQDGTQHVDKTGNDPFVYGCDASLSLTKVRKDNRRNFSIGVGALALNGNYTSGRNFRTLSPYLGIKVGFMSKKAHKTKSK